MPAHDWNRFWKEIEATPSEFVAHKHAHPGGASVLDAERLALAAGDAARLCAGAGHGLALRAGVDGVVGFAGELGADDRPHQGRLDFAHRRRPRPRWSTPRRRKRRSGLRLTSRVAESLFWMGRYAERAEVTTRILRIVQMQAWPLTESATARQRRPLWAAMAAISGHTADFFVKPSRDAVTPREVPFYFLLDRRNGGSVLSYLQSCRQNAENIREHFPPEVWSVLNHLYLEVALHADQSTTERVRRCWRTGRCITRFSRSSTS